MKKCGMFLIGFSVMLVAGIVSAGQDLHWVTQDQFIDFHPAVAIDHQNRPWVLFCKDLVETKAMVVGYRQGDTWIWPQSSFPDGQIARGDVHPRAYDIICDHAGNIWVVYVESDTPAIKTKMFNHESWSDEILVATHPGHIYQTPYFALDHTGVLWLAYSRNDGAGSTVPVSWVWDSSAWQPGIDPEAYPPHDEPNLLQDELYSLVSGFADNGAGELWMLLTSSVLNDHGLPANWNLRGLVRSEAGDWGWAPPPNDHLPGMLVEDNTAHQHGGWGRALNRVGNDNDMVILWTHYPHDVSIENRLRTGPYSIFSRTFRQGEWTPITPVMPTGRAAALPTGARDLDGKLWVAYEAWCGCPGNEFNIYAAATDNGTEWQVAPGEFFTRLTWQGPPEQIHKGLVTGTHGVAWLLWRAFESGSLSHVKAMWLGELRDTPTPIVSESPMPTEASTATPVSTPTPDPDCWWGDADGNGFVNGEDYRAVRDHFGQTTTGDGDADCSGFVNSEDYRAVRNYFGVDYRNNP